MANCVEDIYDVFPNFLFRRHDRWKLYNLEFSKSYLKKFIIKKNDKFVEKRFMKV